MSPGYLTFLPGLATVIAIAACSSIAYSPRPLDADATASEFLARSAGIDELKRFAVANGYDEQAWPPRQWSLRELTLVALYFNPDIRTARSRADIARAELGSATQPEPWAGRFKPEHHSRPLPDATGPWTLGLELEIPLVAQGKRAARAERGAFLADAADLDVASAAWLARSRVRDRYLELRVNRDTLASIDAQLAARKEMLALVNRRVEAGMLSARDVAVERVAFSQLELMHNQEMARRQRAQGELAAALGLPLEVFERMTLRFDADVSPGIDMDAGVLRGLALRNRLDVLRKLLEFGAADAEVKAAVAAQNPDISLGPGYTWDQGDNIWSLALGLSLPPAARTRATIREAQARRELAAEQFTATQAAVIGLAAQAGAQYRLARESVAGAERQLQLQQEQESRINRQFDTGAADRMQRIAVRIETLAAQSLLQFALDGQRQALAQLEDAVQRPLLGDFAVLPDAAIQRSATLANGVAKP